MRRAAQLEVPFHEKLPDDAVLPDSERNLIYLLSQFKNKILESGSNYAPSVIAMYAYDLAKEYNRFYTEVPIFKEERTEMVSFRVSLSGLVAQTIARAMGLLGVEVPERM